MKEPVAQRTQRFWIGLPFGKLLSSIAPLQDFRILSSVYIFVKPLHLDYPDDYDEKTTDQFQLTRKGLCQLNRLPAGLNGPLAAAGCKGLPQSHSTGTGLGFPSRAFRLQASKAAIFCSLLPVFASIPEHVIEQCLITMTGIPPKTIKGSTPS
ncbi:hypothetical protein Ddc_11720 [Ditylenchus destructor]|nr:hypothetical protein Ddc_11720 [Ditylenchus destructor]